MFSMSRNKIVYSALTLAVAFNSAMAFAAEGERTVTLQEDIAQAELLRLEIPAGDVEIIGTAGTGLTAVVTVVCQKENQENCYKLIKELGWSKKTGTVTELSLSPAGITRYDHITLKVKIGVPKDKKLDVNLSAGELRISDTSACLTAEVNAGELNIRLKENQFASAELSAKVGDAHVISPTGEKIEGDRSLLVGANASWKGTGSCQTKASVLAGEVQLRLN
ncbi:DUF4097 family beta strand repeat-containing protein [Cellvibrio zantedeschiae]|nr:DUF4097 family beta strand repeat-containing protein [Cellvibrio zantedeschiae]